MVSVTGMMLYLTGIVGKMFKHPAVITPGSSHPLVADPYKPSVSTILAEIIHRCFHLVGNNEQVARKYLPTVMYSTFCSNG